MAKVIYRKGEQKDLKAVLGLIQELANFEKAPDEVTLTLEELTADGFGPNPIYSFFVAEADEVVIGFALFYEKYSTWKGRCLYLEDFYVQPTFRQMGVGERLFYMVKEEARKRGSKRMEWQVLDWNEIGLNFYKKHEAELDPTWFNGRFNFAQLQEKQWV